MVGEMNSIAIFLTAFVFSLHLALPAATWLTHRRTIASDPMARLWYAGAMAHAAVVLLIGLRPVLPTWMGFHAAAILAATSMGLMMEAIRREAGMRPIRWRHAVSLLMVWGLLFSALYAMRDDGTPGIAAMSACLATLDVVMAILLWKLYRRIGRSSLILMLCAALIAATGHVTRGVIALDGRPPFDPRVLEPWTAFIVTCWVLSFILLYVGGLGYLLEKAQDRLRDSMLREQAAVYQRERALEEVRLRDEMLMNNARLAAASATSLYTSAIIHEISQPLQTMRLALESMARNARHEPLAPSHARDLQDMQAVASDAMAVVTTLRGLLATGQVGVSPVMVADALRDVVKVIEAEARRRGVAFRADLATLEGQEVHCDRVMLQRIVFNLAANSFDELRDAGGPSQLALRAARIQEDGQAWIELTVTDSGRGIPAQVADSLELGWQSLKHSGMGLGLRLTRELLTRWNGRMQILPGPDATSMTGVARAGSNPGTCVRLLLVPVDAGRQLPASRHEAQAVKVSMSAAGAARETSEPAR